MRLWLTGFFRVVDLKDRHLFDDWYSHTEALGISDTVRIKTQKNFEILVFVYDNHFFMLLRLLLDSDAIFFSIRPVFVRILDIMRRIPLRHPWDSSAGDQIPHHRYLISLINFSILVVVLLKSQISIYDLCSVRLNILDWESQFLPQICLFTPLLLFCLIESSKLMNIRWILCLWTANLCINGFLLKQNLG